MFISSTYTDLLAERQAAVEAILTAGHIPAGMELFAAGDQSQLNVIRRWIDESDVFLLILGGRYGSIEASSGKSYTHLEYEYALQQNKPLFAVVITNEHLEEKVKRAGTAAIEVGNPQKLAEFRDLVLSRVVKFFSDPRDIKLAVHETMAEYNRRDDLKGWIPGNQAVNAGPLAEEIARLGKENSELRGQLAERAAGVTSFNGLTFSELYGLLVSEQANDLAIPSDVRKNLQAIVDDFGDIDASNLHLFWLCREYSINDYLFGYNSWPDAVAARLASYDLVNIVPDPHAGRRFALTSNGVQFALRLMVQRQK